MEDLGDAVLTPLLTPQNASNWYLQALDLLVEMQNQVDSQGVLPYDAAFFSELEICREWYFGRQLGVKLEDEALATWERQLCPDRGTQHESTTVVYCIVITIHAT